MGFRQPPRRSTADEAAATIRRLEDDLYVARLAIIHLAPDEFHSLLESYYSCRTREDTYQWPGAVADAVIDLAVPILDNPHAHLFGPRAYCPLCRGGASGYSPGFTIPEGLRRHLIGFGKTHECPVMEAARVIARNAWESKLERGELEQQQRGNAELVERRKNETLYRVDPSTALVLLEEGLSFLDKPRQLSDGEGGLKWAEQRLFALGFTINVDGREKSYTRRSDDELIVYADLRMAGEIRFRVYQDRGGKANRRTVPGYHTFKIQDRWKNNLNAKVQDGIQAAQRVFSRR
jgi:hypothetical protein